MVMTDWVFRVFEPKQEPREVAVEEGLVFGRARECGDGQLSDPTASGRHARISRVGEDLVIEDLGSSNKTQIARGPALSSGESYSLSPGIVFHLGKTRIEVVEPQPDPTLLHNIGKAGEEAAKAEAPKAEAPKAEAPKAEAPKAEAPKAEAPKAEAPKAEAPKAEAPKAEAPKAEAPKAEAPKAEAPKPKAHEESMPPLKSRTVSPESLSQLDAELGGGTIPAAKTPSSPLAVQANVEAMRPRLVVATEGLRRIVDIRSPVFVIGRREGKEIDLSLDHQGVSTFHAKITFNGTSFFVEDLQSTNKTYLGKEELSPKSRRELAPESRLRFGPIETLFVVDTDADGRGLTEARCAAAVAVLIRKKHLTADQRKVAQGEAKTSNPQRHIGEVLVKTGWITVEQWVEALDEVRIAEIARQASGPGRRIAEVVLLLVLALLIALLVRTMFP